MLCHKNNCQVCLTTSQNCLSELTVFPGTFPLCLQTHCWGQCQDLYSGQHLTCLAVCTQSFQLSFTSLRHLHHLLSVYLTTVTFTLPLFSSSVALSSFYDALFCSWQNSSSPLWSMHSCATEAAGLGTFYPSCDPQECYSYALEMVGVICYLV